MERTVANQPLGQTAFTGDFSEDYSRTAINWAEQHLFERRSVVNEHELWRHALEHTHGSYILPEIKRLPGNVNISVTNNFRQDNNPRSPAT